MLAIGFAAVAQRPAAARGAAPTVAPKFGVYEVELTGDGAVSNPFDTVATVTFTPPSGSANAVTVNAFHDGGDVWRARVYVSEAGPWRWSSRSDGDKTLDKKTGSFTAEPSQLRGRLLPHPKNPRHWTTEDGRWFLNLNDTAYFLLCTHDGKGQPITDDDFSAYLRDDARQGITSVRSFLTSGKLGFIGADGTDAHRWYDIFTDENRTHFRCDELQETDRRLQWMLENYPDLYVQLILFPLGSPYGQDDTIWKGMSQPQKVRVLRHVVARYAAYPQIFWLIANDVHYGEKFPNNNAFVREVGAYIQTHDPWRHPLSTGHARRVPFYFSDENWATYIHLEDEADLAATNYEPYHRFEKPVFLGEDRFEQDHGPVRDPADMPYFQRRLFWAWLLSGGSTNYGGRWWVVDPYSATPARPTAGPPARKNTPYFSTGLAGLDAVPFITRYFGDRRIELPDYVPDHRLVGDPDLSKAIGLKLMRRGTDDYLAYHPNAASEGRNSTGDDRRTARLRIDLSGAQGEFSVEWYRPRDGLAQAGDRVAAARPVELTAPWPGCDVVLRLTRR